MKLNLRGHEDRYAIEQSLLAFFPEERPVYEGEDGDSHAEVTLHEGNVYATGVTTLTYGGKTARGEARVRTAGVSDAYERERLRQRALKLSFFRAARDVTGVTPSWGALTGIRPATVSFSRPSSCKRWAAAGSVISYGIKSPLLRYGFRAPALCRDAFFTIV